MSRRNTRRLVLRVWECGPLLRRTWGEAMKLHLMNTALTACGKSWPGSKGKIRVVSEPEAVTCSKCLAIHTLTKEGE